MAKHSSPFVQEFWPHGVYEHFSTISRRHKTALAQFSWLLSFEDTAGVVRGEYNEISYVLSQLTNYNYSMTTTCYVLDQPTNHDIQMQAWLSQRKHSRYCAIDDQLSPNLEPCRVPSFLLCFSCRGQHHHQAKQIEIVFLFSKSHHLQQRQNHQLCLDNSTSCFNSSTSEHSWLLYDRSPAPYL